MSDDAASTVATGPVRTGRARAAPAAVQGQGPDEDAGHRLADQRRRYLDELAGFDPLADDPLHDAVQPLPPDGRIKLEFRCLADR